MDRLSLYLEKDDQVEKIHFEIRRMINAGYTARDQEVVKKHVEELKRKVFLPLNPLQQPME